MINVNNSVSVGRGIHLAVLMWMTEVVMMMGG